MKAQAEAQLVRLKKNLVTPDCFTLPQLDPTLLPVSFMASCMAEHCTMGGQNCGRLSGMVVSKDRHHLYFPGVSKGRGGMDWEHSETSANT